MPPLPPFNPDESVFKFIIKNVVVAAAFVGAAEMYFKVKDDMRETFCTVAGPAAPSSGPGGYVWSQQKMLPPVVTCPYEWLR